MYSYEEYPESSSGTSGSSSLAENGNIDVEALLEKQIEEDIKHPPLPKQRFNIGDWVTFNHGEYPDHFSFEPWQITHFSYQYSKEGSPMGRIHKSAGMAHSSDCLRYAHPKEIEYYLSGFPKLYNRKKEDYDLVEVGQYNFKIGDFDTSKGINGKELLTFLIETNYDYGETEFLSPKGKEIFSKIILKMCENEGAERRKMGLESLV